jgi:V/A-type H+-transporting ATPase subunit C
MIGKGERRLANRKPKDTDFLTISARVRIFETRLLTREQLGQVLDARSNADAVKLLQEHGYPELDPSDPEKLDRALSAVRLATMEDLTIGLPDLRYLDLFRIKYDYHNVKALLKAKAVGVSPDRMLLDMGRVGVDTLKEAVSGDGKPEELLPPVLAAALAEAADILSTTRDPQLSDMALDRGYYKDLALLADEINSDFLRGWIRGQIDAANLRVLVRTLRMGKGLPFLSGALFEGGGIPREAVLAAAEAGADGLAKLYRDTPLQPAAEAGAAALSGGPLTEFEKLCDNGAEARLREAKYVPFGEEPVLRYLAARETEYTNLRIVLTGRQAGIAPDVIRARLRESVL